MTLRKDFNRAINIQEITSITKIKQAVQSGGRPSSEGKLSTKTAQVPTPGAITQIPFNEIPRRMKQNLPVGVSDVILFSISEIKIVLQHAPGTQHDINVFWKLTLKNAMELRYPLGMTLNSIIGTMNEFGWVHMKDYDWSYLPEEYDGATKAKADWSGSSKILDWKNTTEPVKNAYSHDTFMIAKKRK